MKRHRIFHFANKSNPLIEALIPNAVNTVEGLQEFYDALEKENNVQNIIVGEKYFFRTVTHYYTGRVIGTTLTDVTLVDAAWIPDTGRFSQAMANGEFLEVEPYPDGMQVTVNTTMIVDCVLWPYALPRKIRET